MKFTISDCISRINQALNYPAISYEDVSHFFDQAISELNTSLRIALPTVTEMKAEHTLDIASSPNVIPLTADPKVESKIKVMNAIPSSETPEDLSAGNPIVYYVSTSSYLENSLYIYKNNSWIAVDCAYGIPSADEVYKAIPVANTFAVWRAVSFTETYEFSLTEYLPTDWIILFLIPYVCFKFAVRNGDSGSIFLDEYTNGYQQLQTSYNVPNTVTLSEVADLPAYRDTVVKNIYDLRKKVPTRAITESMRVGNGIRPIYGRGIFEGGWGI